MPGIRKLFDSFPNHLQLPVKYAYGMVSPSIRYGASYRRTYNLLKQSQTWSEEQLYEFQLQELRRLLTYCYDYVPYYRQAFNETGFNPNDLDKLDDIRTLPLLTKDIIRQNIQELKSTNLNKKDFVFQTTGGSSGIPLSFYTQVGFSYEREQAFIAALWDRIGFKFERDKKMGLRGKIPKNPDGIEYQPTVKEITCSTYYTDDAHLFSYYECLIRSKIEYIHGHVSSTAIFAQFMVDNGLYYPLKAVLGGSEKIYPFQKELISKAFGCRLFSWYGQSEQVALAGACEHSDYYHIYPEYGLLEIIDDNNNVIEEPGALGEIVATGFNNYAMPFIRYRTGDMAKYAEGLCSQCGRKYKLLDGVEGRSYEYVITKDGNKISLTGLIFGQHFAAFEHISKMQVYQEEPGVMEIRIMPGKHYEIERCEKEFITALRNAAADQLEVSFAYPDDIPGEGRKHRFLIQKLKH